ncbi:MAG: hypothetical protein ABI688_00545 [Bacteroidota bacterium]
MNNPIITQLSSLLIQIDKGKPAMFAGTGIIVYSDLNKLPVAPLKDSNPPFRLPVADIREIEIHLLEISGFNHSFHDGFHLIDPSFSLTHLSQYFAAPIVQSSIVEYEYGSRYRSAFYGSFLSSVIACGVISNTHHPTIFQQGNKINPYEWLSPNS